jgi:Ca2+-binding EF-hand superfamily protein
MPLFKKKNDKKKKKSIPNAKIIKAIKDQEYVDLGEPFGESARRYLAYKITKLIDAREISGTVITPEGVYVSSSATEIRDMVKLIKAKGIIDFEQIASENNWHLPTVRLIANNRLSLLKRKDGKYITQETASKMVYRKANQGVDITVQDIAKELELEERIVEEMLLKLLNSGEIKGYFIKSTKKFLPEGLLEESIKELIEDLEADNAQKITFSEIAEEYNIADEEVYNLLLKLHKKGDIDVQLNLGQRICYLRENIEREEIEERIPEEERKLEIEDLTQKD